MLQSYTSTLKKVFDFSGRASRAEYWTFSLFNFLIGLVLGLAFFASGKVGSSVHTGNSLGGALLFMVGALVFFLFMFLLSISVGVRRLHDINMSGLWYLVTFIPSVGGLIFLVLTFLPSVNEGNRYGTLDGAPASVPETSLAYDEEIAAVIEEDAAVPESSAAVEAKA